MKRIIRNISALILLTFLFLGLAGPTAAANQRLTYGWLCWSGESAMLSRDAGAWTLHVETARQYLCAIANSGVDEIRVLAYDPWSQNLSDINSLFSPYVIRDGRFDLATFNDWYFPIVRRFIQAANEYGIRVRFCFFDNCQFAGSYPNPWETNVQGITSFYWPDADAYSRPFIDRCIAEFAGLDVSWAFGNENTPPEFVGMARRVLIPAVRAHNLDPSRLYFGATMTAIPWENGDYEDAGRYTTQDLTRAAFGDEFGDDFAHRITREVHGCGAYMEPGSMYHQAVTWWAGKPVGPFEMGDDGEWTGASLCDSEGPARTRPSPAQWTATIEASRGYSNVSGYEHCPKGGPLSCQVQVLSAMYKALHGVAPPQKYVYAPLIQMVQVAVCPTSGLLPNQYCPRTELREFEQGHEPTAICTVHRKPDCSCGAWLDTSHGRKMDFLRWIRCLFGGPKRCK
jgi:hypothetical protein